MLEIKNSTQLMLIIAFALNIQISYAATLGTPEIVILLIVGFLAISLIGGTFALVYAILKRKNTGANLVKINIVQPQQNPISSTVEQNVDADLTSTKIPLPQQYEIRYVERDEIQRCVADDNYTNFLLASGERILISKPLKEYSDLLQPHGFIRVHQSHLVNPKFVKSWLKEDGGILLMNNGDKIPVSKPNREMVKSVLGK